MACGCSDGGCGCFLSGNNGITISGAGNQANPYVISAPPETSFSLTNNDDTLLVTPGGTNGHSPQIDLVIDPASTATVTKSVDGLRIDSATGGAQPVDIVTTNTVLTTANYSVIVDSTAAPVTIFLPPAPSTGERYEIKDYGSIGVGNTETNPVYIDPNGNMLDGLLTPYLLSGNGDAITVLWVGSGWAIM